MTLALAQPFPYQGSKRRLAPRILDRFPLAVERLVEPFCGSAAISIAAVAAGRTDRVWLNDSFAPLAALWRRILGDSGALSEEYRVLWTAQSRDPDRHFATVRAAFNRDGDPAKLLFLLARCVKGAVRFNGRGEFNQAPDRRRAGTRPDRMGRNLERVAALLAGRAVVTALDYAAVLAGVGPRDLVYLDPPYQGTSVDRDPRYHQQLDRPRLVEELARLRARGVPVLVSFDGRHGERAYGPDLPRRLGLARLALSAGRSSQATLLGRAAETVESLYVSPELLRGGRRRG
ncbi:MAG: DNA adenine methylase [Polyangiaceae bacterium]|nr:DNA adenine methylase [Polyangiaceae bacterium]